MAGLYSIAPSHIEGPVAAATAFGVIATFTTILRFYAMHLKGIRPGGPEWLLVGSNVLMVGALSTIWIMTLHGGMGRHVDDVTTAATVITLKTLLSLEVVYAVCLALAKTSMAMFFVRIFGAKRSFNISVAVVLCIVWAWAIMVILECFLLCRPFAYNWDKSVEGSCGDRRAAFIVAGVLNVITDLMVMGLPLPHVWTLKLNMQKKIGLTSVFCVGVVISAISVVRLVSLAQLNFEDPTWSLLEVVLWSVIEPQLAIVCANMPFFKTIIAHVAPGLGSSKDRDYGHSSKKSFGRLTKSHQTYDMDHLTTGNHHVEIGNGSSASKEPTTDAQSIDSDERQLASHPGPYGISVTQKIDVQYD